MMPNGYPRIHFEEDEDGVYGIVATDGDVQVGWCRKHGRHWYLFNMDEGRVGGDFDDFKVAEAEGIRLFNHLSGARNSGY